MEHDKKKHVVKHCAVPEKSPEKVKFLCLLNYYAFEKGAQNRICVTEHLKKDSRKLQRILL